MLTVAPATREPFGSFARPLICRACEKSAVEVSRSSNKYLILSYLRQEYYIKQDTLAGSQ